MKAAMPLKADQGQGRAKQRTKTVSNQLKANEPKTSSKSSVQASCKCPSEDIQRSANSKAYNSDQIKRAEKHEINHLTLKFHLLQARDVPETSLFHQMAKHSPIRPSLSSWLSPLHSPTSSEPLTKSLTHFTVPSQKLFLFPSFVILSQMLIYLLLPPPPT